MNLQTLTNDELSKLREMRPGQADLLIEVQRLRDELALVRHELAIAQLALEAYRGRK